MKEIKIKDFFSDSKAYFIAVSKYTPPVSPLQSPGKDVDRIKNILSKHHNFNTPNVTHINKDGSTHVFSNPLLDPTKVQLLNFLSSIKANDNDRVLLYFACHGIAIDSEDNPKGYILPVSAVPGVWESFIEMKEIFDLINSLSCKHLLIVLDCCYAGAFRWASQTRSLGSEVPKTIYQERFEQYTKNKSCQVLTSSAHDQTAIDTLRLGKREDGDPLSPFASLLVEALEQGSADAGFGNVNPDGIITITEISLFLQEKIFNLLHEKGIDADNRQLPTLFPIVDSKRKLVGKGEFVFLNPTMESVTLKQKQNSNPYKGLFSYSKEESNLFYGRERVLKGWYENNHFKIGLIEASTKFDIIVITGPSGIGKSSLAKAGLLAYYEGQANKKTIHEIRPGKSPYTSYSELLQTISQLKDQIILVDQYEELVSVCTNEKERTSFEKKLLEASKNNLVLVTIRSDFENQFKKSLVIGNEVNNSDNKHRFLVPPFSRQELEEIVVQPAAQEVLEFKVSQGQSKNADEFINKIVDEANQNPGSLPLLSMALSELYKRKEYNNLLESEYKKFGGLVGIMDEIAEDAYDEFKSNQQDEALFRQLIFRMISFETGRITKKRIYTDLENNTDASPYIDELVFEDNTTTGRIKVIAKKLVEKRLLIPDLDETGKPFIEPSHDSLLRSWTPLTEWIKEKEPKTNLSGQDIISLLKTANDAAYSYFVSRESDKIKLLESWTKHPKLKEIEQLIFPKLNNFEKSFFNKVKIHRRRSKSRLAIIASCVILAISVALLLVFNQKKRVDQLSKKNDLKIINEHLIQGKQYLEAEASVLALDQFLKSDSVIALHKNDEEFKLLKKETDSLIKLCTPTK